MTDQDIGTFIGLSGSSYEYIANIIAPYRSDFAIEIGCFLLIDDSPSKLVARVIDFVPQGELISGMGQKWLNDVAFEADAIGADIKKRKISYSVKIKILGSIDEHDKFNPGLKKIPHITSKVVKPGSALVEKIIHRALNEQEECSEIGTYYLDQKIKVKFNLSDLIAKRTFIFARAGYGKSNLMKVLASNWKKEFGGLVVFDPDGEYANTDNRNRPGLMDKTEAILITNRQESKNLPNVYPNLNLNLKSFSPKFIVPIIVNSNKHENIFFSKLMGLSQTKWNDLVDLFYSKGWAAEQDEIKAIVSFPGQTETDINALRNNLARQIQDLHDSNSHLMEIIESAIRRGLILILDISRLDSQTSLMLSSLVVKHILNKNQRNFTHGSAEELMRATFVVDEAQSVLSKEANVEAFVKLAKEGRKYLLGGIFITQQPGSIPFDILSQADNFFVFHLLSRGDLDTLQKANAHYSNDIVTQILNEPIPGKSYMWTSVQPFVLAINIINFETIAQPHQSINLQGKSKLLSAILKEITDKFSSSEFKSIIRKYKEVEIANIGKDTKDKTIPLFQKLDEKEKEYLRKQNALQAGPSNNEFAVTFQYYNSLSQYSHELDPD